MVVQHNISAMTANRYYTNNNSALGKSLEKLSSGLAINRAGDNAAGLAVSEKMRAQISGMTQASKNAQDGISMVQTFEGALQETDSILQRMRTLAVQSANGSYADEVDRDAIQLEFDQLNDELNQIADTDYNGVVVLNGGEMADGVKSDDKGKIDYQAKIAEDQAEKKLVDSAEDFCGDTDGAGKVVDNAGYNKTEADSVWTKLGLKDAATGDLEAEDINVTFTYDGSKWNATGVTDSEGNAIEVTDEQLASLTTTKQGNGGFSIDDTSLNLVFDTSDVQKYDTATVNLTNTNAGNDAPDNIGVAESTFNTTGLTAGTATASDAMVTLASGVTDGNMTQDMADALNALKNTTVTQTFTAGAGTSMTFSNADESGVAVDGTNIKLGVTDNSATDGTYAVWYEDASGTKTDLATVSFAETGAGTTVGDAISGTADTTEVAAAASEITSGLAFAVKDSGGNATTLYANVDGEGKTLDFYKKNADDTFTKIGNAAAVAAANYTDTSGNAITGASGDGKKLATTDGTDPATPITGTADTTQTLEAAKPAVVATEKYALNDGTNDVDVYNTNDGFYKSADGGTTFEKITDFTGYTTPDGSSVVNDNGTLKSATTATSDTEGDVTFKINLDSFNFSDDDGLSATTVATPDAAKPTTEVDNSDMVAVSNALGNGTRNLTYAQSMSLQTGARSKDLVEFTFKYNSDGMGDLKANMNCSAREDGLGTKDLSLKTQAEANAAIDKIDNAINKVSMVRATFGAIQNRLEHKISNLDTNAENVTAAESRIRDTQMDQEMMKFTSAQILSQASQSMLAQANSLPQGVLQLLG